MRTNCSSQCTLASISCEVLSAARRTMTVRHLTILRHILTMALLVTVDTKDPSDTHYRQIIYIMNSSK